MLSGKRAFRGGTAADTMSAILKEEPEELSECARNVPAPLERMVRHCLEKNPGQRFQSAGDVAFNLESLADSSVSSRTSAQAVISETAGGGDSSKHPHPSGAWTGHPIALPIALALAVATLALGWWVGRGSVKTSLAEYQQITFRTGSMGNARFTPDGSIIYSAAWDGGESQLYMARTDENGARELGL